MSDIFSFPQKNSKDAEASPIVTIDVPYFEDDNTKRHKKAENIALLRMYGERLDLYRQQELNGDGARNK